jgi:large repetitive protein
MGLAIAGGALAVFALFFVFSSLSAHAQPGPSSEGVGVSIIISTGGGPPAQPAVGQVIINGKAYPGAVVTILRDGAVAASFLANSGGDFSRTFGAITPGIHTFSLFAEDLQGRTSVTLNLTISVTPNATTRISGLVIPPTISANPATVVKGDSVRISGSSFPASRVFLLFSAGGATQEVRSGTDGTWRSDIDSSALGEGSYSVKARTVTVVGEQSEFSQEVTFTVAKRGEGDEGDQGEDEDGEEPPPELPDKSPDFDRDGIVGLRDFSIMMYWWQRSYDPIDLNSDGIVNFFDFSILLYWWGRALPL